MEIKEAVTVIGVQKKRKAGMSYDQIAAEYGLPRAKVVSQSYAIYWDPRFRDIDRRMPKDKIEWAVEWELVCDSIRKMAMRKKEETKKRTCTPRLLHVKKAERWVCDNCLRTLFDKTAEEKDKDQVNFCRFCGLPVDWQAVEMGEKHE